MRTRVILFLIFISVNESFCQNRNNIWCFGDSAGIDFNNINNPVPYFTGMNSRGSCASISDTSGNLQFYVAGDTVALYAATLRGGKIYNKLHQLMQGGDSIVTRAWYNEEVIVPSPSDTNLFYVFTCGVTSIYGFYYSVVDLNQNGGLGSVIQKNIQLKSFACDDGINAIKHGNGRDWWVVFRKSGFPPESPNNNFYQYLITPGGISNVIVQTIGSINSFNSGKITFSPTGDKIIYTNRASLLEMYDFNRCTGVISNPVTIFPEQLNPPKLFFGSEFSPNGNVLYVTIVDQTSYLFQFDLTAASIATSIDTIWNPSYPTEAIGQLKRAPDGKIYESGPYTTSIFIYPYPDSLRNVYNENLGVINFPDSLGSACDFQPYSFYLGGKRTYWGLPNNPDYDLGATTGSICDSLTGITNNEQEIKNELFVYYNSSWQKAFINAKGLKGKNVKISVYDLLGNIIYTEEEKLFSQYFTRDLNMAAFAKGMYVVNLVTEKERMVKKFVKD